MHPLLILAATATLGIEVGWQPLAEGGHEYTIQLEPQLLRILETGREEITSEVPPGLDVRRYRITVGTGRLARDAGQPPSAAPSTAEPNRTAPAAPQPALPEPPLRDPAPAQPASAEPTDADPYGTQPGDQPPPAEPAPAEPAPPAAGPGEPAFPASDPFAAGEAPSPSDGASPPQKLPDSNAAGPIQPAKYDAGDSDKNSGARVETTNKPQLRNETASKPWATLVISVALLCCSLGANLFLGWNLWDARNRYRHTVEKLRTAGT